MRKSGLTIQIAIVAGVINCVAWYVFAKIDRFLRNRCIQIP
jgi:uncharacterized membrane protein